MITTLPLGVCKPIDTVQIYSQSVLPDSAIDLLAIGFKKKSESSRSATDLVQVNDVQSRIQHVCSPQILKKLIATTEFTANAKSFELTTILSEDAKCNQLSIFGLGTPNENTIVHTLIESAKTLASRIRKKTITSLAIVFEHDETPEHIQVFLETFLLEITADTRFFGTKKKGHGCTLTELIMVADIVSFPEIVEKAKANASGACLTRQLVFSPPNYCNPITMANVARDLSTECGLDCTIYDEKEAMQMEMGAFLSVNQGSSYPAQFIHMQYKPKEISDLSQCKTIALVGKCITFDAGGYNIKSASSNIELMKFDMGGAAAVLGAAKIIATLKPKNVIVHFILPAAENMVSDKSYRPGDVITASNKKTIEVTNTDAEGRMTLADALVYAEKLNPHYIVDIATLTGSCMMALGLHCGGLFCADKNLCEMLEKSAKVTGERVWNMPLIQEYAETLKSTVADFCNTGSKYGSAITAALFLNEFVEKTPYAHLDIAGPAWDWKNREATGYGARLLSNFVLSVDSDEIQK